MGTTVVLFILFEYIPYFVQPIWIEDRTGSMLCKYYLATKKNMIWDNSVIQKTGIKKNSKKIVTTVVVFPGIDIVIMSEIEGI